MVMITICRLKCDGCGTSMKGRTDERNQDLRQRAESAGWKHGWEANWRDLCQVCAAKEG